MATLVMKFGGLAVGTTTALTQVLSIVLHEREQWEKLIVVVSALEGVTDALLEATRLAQVSNQRGYRRIVATLRTRHFALVEHLPFGQTERQAIQADLDRLLFEMLDHLQSIAHVADQELSAEHVDLIVGTGERLAARIVAALLRQNNVRAVAIDSQGIIVTDETFGNAVPNLDLSQQRITENLLPMLDRNIVPVVTGFIGSTQDGRTTTLGRGGSDYTASVIGYCADAKEVWVWTTVDGMMTTDPNDIPDAIVIPTMTYDEIAEMAYFGARVLHARMIEPLREQHIPLSVKNVFKPGAAGTQIIDQKPRKQRVPKAVTLIQGVGLSAPFSGALSSIIAAVNDVLLYTAGNPADVMITSQSSGNSFMCFIVPTSSGPDAARASAKELQQRLEDHPTLSAWSADVVSIVTIINAYINEMPDVIANTLQRLQDVPVLAIAHGPSNCSFSIVVQPTDAYRAVEQIHEYIIAPGTAS